MRNNTKGLSSWLKVLSRYTVSTSVSCPCLICDLRHTMWFLWACVFCDIRRGLQRGNGPLSRQFLGADWSTLAIAAPWLADPMHCCDTEIQRRGWRNSLVLCDCHNNDCVHFITMLSALSCLVSYLSRVEEIRVSYYAIKHSAHISWLLFIANRKMGVRDQ